MGAFEDLLRQQLEESSRDFAPESVAQPIRTIENYLGKEYWTTNPIKQSYNLVHYPIGKKPGTKKEALEPPDLLPSPEIRDLFTPWSSHAIRQRKKNELSGWKFKHHKTGKMHPVEYMSNRNTKFGSTFIDTYGPNNEEKRIRNPYSTGAVTDFPLLPAKSLLGTLALNYFETIPWAMVETGQPCSALATGLSPWAIPKALAAGGKIAKAGVQTGAKTVSNLAVMEGYNPLTIMRDVKKAFKDDWRSAVKSIWYDYPMNESLLRAVFNKGHFGKTDSMFKPIIPQQAGYFRHLFGLPRFPNVPTTIKGQRNYKPPGASKILRELDAQRPTSIHDFWKRIKEGYDYLDKANPMYKMSYKGIKDYPHAFWKVLPHSIEDEAKKWLRQDYDPTIPFMASKQLEGISGSGLRGAPDFHRVLADDMAGFGNFDLMMLPRTTTGPYPKGTKVTTLGYEDISDIGLNTPQEIAAFKEGMGGLGKSVLNKLNPFSKSPSWKEILDQDFWKKDFKLGPFQTYGGHTLPSLLTRYLIGKTSINPPIRNFGEFDMLEAGGRLVHPLKHGGKFGELKNVHPNLSPEELLKYYWVPRFTGHVMPQKNFSLWPWTKNYIKSFEKGKQNDFMVEGLLKHWFGVKSKLTDPITGKLTKKAEAVKKALQDNPVIKKEWDKVLAERVKSGKSLDSDSMYKLKKDFNQQLMLYSDLGMEPPKGFMKKTKKGYKKDRYGVYRMANPTQKEVDYWASAIEFWKQVNKNKYVGPRRFGQRYKAGAEYHPGEVGGHLMDPVITRTEFNHRLNKLRDKFSAKAYASNQIPLFKIDKMSDKMFNPSRMKGSDFDPIKHLKMVKDTIDNLKVNKGKKGGAIPAM